MTGETRGRQRSSGRYGKADVGQDPLSGGNRGSGMPDETKEAVGETRRDGRIRRRRWTRPMERWARQGEARRSGRINGQGGNQIKGPREGVIPEEDNASSEVVGKVA